MEILTSGCVFLVSPEVLWGALYCRNSQKPSDVRDAPYRGEKTEGFPKLENQRTHGIVVNPIHHYYTFLLSNILNSFHQRYRLSENRGRSLAFYLGFFIIISQSQSKFPERPMK